MNTYNTYLPAEIGTGFAVILSEIKSGQLPNTISIEGGDNAGRKKAAILCAAALLCENSDCPCLKCPVCEKVKMCHHPDVTLVSKPEGESVKIDYIRHIRQDAYATAFEADKKIYIFDNAQKLSVQCQNALLKILEEPPRNVYFILTCPSGQMLLPTVASRCTSFSLGTLGKDDIYRAVCEIAESKNESEKKRLASIISKLDGFDINNSSIEALSAIMPICEEFYKTGDFAADAFSAKKEDIEHLKLTLKVLSLCALECLEYKKGARKMPWILTPDTLNTAASRLSVKYALHLYEFFCEVFERLCANANVNAVISAINCEILR